MKMKKSVFMIMVAAALAGCSQSDINEPQLEGDDVIRLGSTMLTAGASTRAPFVGSTISATNPLTALVPSATASAGYESTTLHVAGPMIFKGDAYTGYDVASVTATEARFPNGFAGTDPLYLFGLYPYNKTTPVWVIDTGGATATATFNGSHDVMAAAEISTTKDDVKDAVGGGSTPFGTLAFEHLLTKLEVKFKASAAALLDFGSIKSVELVSVDATQTTLPTEVTYDPVAETVDFASGSNKVAVMPFYGATTASGVTTYTDVAYTNKAYMPTTTDALQAYCLAAPATASASPAVYEYYIRIVTNGGDSSGTTKILPIDLNDADGTKFATSTAGYAFNIIVNYTVDDIYVTATVTDWKVGGDTTVPGI